MSIFLFLFCNIFTWTPVLSFFSKAELQSYNVFVKPYGLDLVKLIPSMSPSILACIRSHGAELQTCNDTSLNIIPNTSRHDLKEMFDQCPTGQLGCFQNQTNSSFIIRVLRHLDDVMKTMCRDQCWKKVAFVSRSCIRKNTTGFMTAENNALQFISEVLDATCFASQSKGLTCAEKQIHGILQRKGDPHEVCNVNESLKAEPKNCSSACYQELQQFYTNLGCCVGSVRDMTACYNISYEGDSFGAFVENSLALCHLSPPKACTRMEIQCPTMVSTVSTQTSSKSPGKTSSHSAMKIAGICIAIVVIAVGLMIMGRFIYQRIKRKEKLHLEDYGYSRLKMMEDDLYNDFTDDSDFEGFIAM